MPWWGWITIGALMLAAELAFVDAEFYLVFLGVSALLIGGLELSGLMLPTWVQWILFAVVSVGTVVLFRQRVYVLVRPPPEGEVQQGVDGDVAIATAAIAPGDSGAVELRGSTWTAFNEGETTIPDGGRCIVTTSKSLTLRVRSAD